MQAILPADAHGISFKLVPKVPRPHTIGGSMIVTGSSSAASAEISVHPPQRFLFGPGPTQVHPRVYEAMGQPVVGHLDPYFFQVSTDNERMLRSVFGTKNELTFMVSGTGSAGMETAISNFVDPS